MQSPTASLRPERPTNRPLRPALRGPRQAAGLSRPGLPGPARWQEVNIAPHSLKRKPNPKYTHRAQPAIFTLHVSQKYTKVHVLPCTTKNTNTQNPTPAPMIHTPIPCKPPWTPPYNLTTKPCPLVPTHPPSFSLARSTLQTPSQPQTDPSTPIDPASQLFNAIRLQSHTNKLTTL